MMNGMMADDGILGEVLCVHARHTHVYGIVNTRQWLDLGFQSFC